MNKRRLFILVGFLAFALILLANFHRLGEFTHDLRQARWYVLVLIVVAQLAGYLFQAKFYQRFVAMFAEPPRLAKLFRMSLALNFVNQAFPSGGVAALPYLRAQLDPLPGGKVTLTHFVKYLFTYISFMAILLLGFIVLFLTGDVDALASRITLLVVLAIISLSIISFGIMSNPAWQKAVLDWGSAVVNRFGRAVLRRKNDIVREESRQRFVAEFAEGYATLRENKHQAFRPLGYLLGYGLTEVATIYVVFLSFGRVVNPGIVIAAYTLANIISVLGVVTGGIGVFEATMIATFVALGTPVALATAVVIVYRVLNLAVFLPLGFYFYRESLRLES